MGGRFVLDKILRIGSCQSFLEIWDTRKQATKLDDTDWTEQRDAYFVFEEVKDGCCTHPLTFVFIGSRFEVIEEELLNGCLDTESAI